MGLLDARDLDGAKRRAGDRVCPGIGDEGRGEEEEEGGGEEDEEED